MFADANLPPESADVDGSLEGKLLLLWGVVFEATLSLSSWTCVCEATRPMGVRKWTGVQSKHFFDYGFLCVLRLHFHPLA